MNKIKEVNDLGRFLKKLRIDNDERVRDMASMLGVTPSYLSSIEHGKRKISPALLTRIAAVYVLNREEQKLLYLAAELSEEKIIVDIKNYPADKRLFVLRFLKSIEFMNEERMRKISKVLESCEEE